MVLWKRWTEARTGRVEREKLLKTDQKALTSFMGWRCVRVVLCAVVIGGGDCVCEVLVEDGIAALAKTEVAFVLVGSVLVVRGGEVLLVLPLVLPLPSFSYQKSHPWTRGGGRSCFWSAARPMRLRAGESLSVLLWVESMLSVRMGTAGLT